MATLNIKTPALGSYLSLETFTINRETLGGDLKQVRPSSWPEVQVQHFKFISLKPAKKDELITFIIDHQGEYINIQEDSSYLWYGMIISKDIEIVQTTWNKEVGDTAANDTDLYTVEFDFEG